MRVTDLIRNVLDLIDQIDKPVDTTDNISNEPGEQTSRFKQIYAILQNSRPISTEPNETVTGIESVTTLAGGGVNGPKHADDIRVKDPRGYRE